jgi:protocatechuate 3,4-dioxygenase alpha subunit
MADLLGLTPSQTAGPYLHIGLTWSDGPNVVPDSTEGAIVVSGRVFDGAGEPVIDALVESWQADPAGRFDHPDDPRGAVGPTTAFRGFGRCPTDESGRYRLVTVKPGRLPTPDGALEAPHLTVSVFGRGLLDRLVTRVYFADEPVANAEDPVLASLPDAARRQTLIAKSTGDGYRLDIHLRGPDETVFFDV